MQPLTLFLFGLATLASGLYRFLSADGGEKGLGFGVAMGALAICGALALARGRRGVGLTLGWVAALLVGAWFVYEALIMKGLDEAEPRQLALIAGAVFVAIVLLRRSRSADSPVGDSHPRDA